MSTTITRVTVHRASSTGATDNQHELVIEAKTPLEVDNSVKLYDLARTFKTDAARIAEALFTHLPGGTIDALVAEMMARRASLFVVPWASHLEDEAEPEGVAEPPAPPEISPPTNGPALAPAPATDAPMFKVGQIVVAVAARGCQALTEGKQYKVTGCSPAVYQPNFTWPAYVDVVNDWGKQSTHYAYRFRELREDEQPLID